MLFSKPVNDLELRRKMPSQPSKSPTSYQRTRTLSREKKNHFGKIQPKDNLTVPKTRRAKTPIAAKTAKNMKKTTLTTKEGSKSHTGGREALP